MEARFCVFAEISRFTQKLYLKKKKIITFLTLYLYTTTFKRELLYVLLHDVIILIWEIWLLFSCHVSAVYELLHHLTTPQIYLVPDLDLGNRQIVSEIE